MSHDDLHQQLLEFIYGLLSDDEAARMNARITSEPHVARAYAEVKQQADRLAKAAKLVAPQVALKRPSASAAREIPAAFGASPAVQRPTSAASALRWLVALAAVALVAMTGYFALSPASPLRDESVVALRREAASKQLRMVVTGPAEFSPGAPSAYSIATTSVDDQPVAAKLKYALYAPQSGELLLAAQLSTDAQGRAQIHLPPDKLVPSARLEIAAENGGEVARMTTHVVVEKVRYATQLATDKPLYRPGETLRYRSLTLTRFGLTSDRELPVAFQILDPSGGVVAGSQQTGYTDHGVASGEFPIASHLAGGTYTLVVSSAEGDPAFPEERREFFVRQYRLPRLKKELELARDSYAPGEEVVADFSAERAEGGAVAEAQLTISAVVDGATVFSGSPQASADGTHQIKFTLPKEIERGAATLSVIVDDGGNRETIAKTIPINLGRIEVEFYAEGGDLVAGLENRVYFFAHDPAGEPMDFSQGRIVDSQGREVARAATYHEGRGVFRFTPAIDETYRLEVMQPADVQVVGEMPAVEKDALVVLSTGDGVFAAGQPITFDILAAKARLPLVVTAVCRGTQVAQREFVTQVVRSITDGENSKSRIAFDLPPEVSGVVRLTVYDYSQSPPQPLAERLVYRRPAEKLHIALAEGQREFSPGEHVALTLNVTDEHGSPTSAALGIAVVDDALLNLADDKSPRMPTYFLLASEIEKPEDLEDANFYLLEEKQDDKNPANALDLLLGTQGWRRFLNFDISRGPTARADTPSATDEARGVAPRLAHLVALEGTTEFPTLYDNLSDVTPAFDAQLASANAARQGLILTLGRLAFGGGAAILLCVLLLAVARAGCDWRFWLPVTAMALACVVVGGLWMSARVDSQGQVALTGFVLLDDSKSQTQVTTKSESNLDQVRSPEGAIVFDEFAEGVVLNLPLVANEELAALGDAVATPVAPATPPPIEVPAEQPAGEPVADLEGGGRGGFAANAGGALELAKRERFAQLGDIGENLLKEFDERGGGRWREKFGNFDGEMWFDGTVHDVARMRTLWQRATKSDDEKAALALGQAYQELLKKYRLPVREYAHQHVASEPGVRSDFTEVVCWRPLVIADQSGQAKIEFDLSDSITAFQILADAHGAGRIGTGGGAIVSRIPFSLEPKLPLEVTAGDRIELPLAVNNDTTGALPVTLKFSQLGELLALDGDADRTITLDPRQRYRETFALNVIGQTGTAELKFQGLAGPLADAIARKLTVVPPGFPIAQSYAGQVDGDETITVKLPEDWVAGSLEVTLAAFPSSLAELQKGMEGMLRDPNGCFEQTSSTNYPNVLALTYMEEHNVADPSFTKRARELLKSGYEKLTSFECQEPTSDKKAFEWFGGWPAHEALTAYGILEFRDMQRVWEVDPKLIDRASAWLLARRDGKGGFERNPQALDSFGAAPQEITNAYIVWALTEAKQPSIEKEVTHVLELAAKSADPYIVSLAAASASNAARKDDAAKLMTKLAGLQQDDGRLEAKETSITSSGGLALTVETTALAALAWLKDPAMTAHANKAVEWITKNRQDGGDFGSTQSTILALKALVEHAKANRRTVAAGELIVRRDGEEISRRAFGAGENDAIEIAGLAAQLQPGENELTISLTGDNAMPYALSVNYRAATPVSDENCPVRLATKLSAENMSAGDVAQVSVQLENVSGQGQPMTVALVGLPAGLEPRVEQLDELRDAGKFDFYELRPREIVFYWRGLSPEAKEDKAIGFNVDVVAEIPGRYTGPASRTYLYYTAEQKQWVSPLAVEIKP